MDATEQAIWLIESRLSDNPRLAEIAAEAGLSRYYLSRLFAETTGKTFTSYVKGRRLSEAAKALLGGADSILEVALAHGYGSHEAFTRAFRGEFGLTPEAFRDRNAHHPVKLVEPIRMNARSTKPTEPAVIADLPAATYVGLSRRYKTTELGAIPGQWAEFKQHLTELERGIAYGIVHNAASNGEDVEYTCALPYGAGLASGNGLIELTLPAMRVAKFKHGGHISAIQSTCRAIFGDCLARHGLRPAQGVDLIEVYGLDFDPISGFGTVGLWVPVV